MNYPICETIENYELSVDIHNQCLKDLNLSELKQKYKNKTFRCCGVDYTPKKRSQFLSQHILTKKHIKFVSAENESHKQTYGCFTDINNQFTEMRKEIRDLKSQLHYKTEEIKYKNEELSKLKDINTQLYEETQKIKMREANRFKKLKIVTPTNLIDS